MTLNLTNQEHTCLKKDLNTTYTVKDRIPMSMGDSIGLSERERQFGPMRGEIKAVWTGEKRCPKKGEWYLSGAIVEAYLAPNDLSTVFAIARLVRVKTVTVEIVEAIPDPEDNADA